MYNIPKTRVGLDQIEVGRYKNVSTGESEERKNEKLKNLQLHLR